MKFYQVRDLLIQGNSINNLHLKVTYYARVSTDSDEQLNSLDNQVKYFEEYIKNNPNWTYVNGYIDEGISGSSVKGRVNFLRMIEDSKKEMFDLIITKEVSRFSRNLLDSIKFTQILMNNNVGVFFQTNGINTYDTNSEFILNMMGSVAQEEVKRLSERIKWGHKQAIRNGRVLGSNRITGYNKDNAKLVIDEKEALFIKKVFHLYISKKCGLSKLAKILYDMGYKNRLGNIYSKATLLHIIKNPKYKGYYCGQTTKVVDYKTKKRAYVPEKEWIIYKDKNIPAIVSEEIWERANEILKKRSEVVKNETISIKKLEKKYSYSSKIFCKEHNQTFQRITGTKNKNNPRWACGYYIKYRIKACESPIISEIDLNNILKNVTDNFSFNKTKIVEEMINYYCNFKQNGIYNIENNLLKKNIDNLITKKEKILELLIEKRISSNEFEKRNNEYNNDIIKYEGLEKENNNDLKNINYNDLKIKIEDETDFKNNIDDFIEIFVSKIMVSKINNNRRNILLEIFLNFSNNQYVLKDNEIYDFNKSILFFSGKSQTLSRCTNKFLKNKFEYNVYIINEEV